MRGQSRDFLDNTHFVRNEVEFCNDVDLGKVMVGGDLAQIDAGDGDPAKPALVALSVHSLGVANVSARLFCTPAPCMAWRTSNPVTVRVHEVAV